RYDRFGPEGVSGGGDPFAGGGLGDIFEAFFGGGGFGGGRSRGPAGPPRGPDLEATATLAFEDAVFGCEHEITVRTAVPCEECSGTGGADGSAPSTCPDCNGAGEVRTVRNSMLGQIMSTQPCRKCSGQGAVVLNPCLACQGDGRVVTDKAFTVDIPAGVDAGSTLRLSGRGAVGPRGGPSGDLYVKIRVRGSDRFERSGVDVLHRLPVTMTQAALGHHIKFETMDGVEDLVISKGTQSGTVQRLKGRGVPHLDGHRRGDLLVEIVVVTPTDLSSEEVAVMQQLAELRGEVVEIPDSGLLSRLRSAFK
ncbi:MAG TPA: molecular chaperone DnaJ, partial [Acidimicrobiaceae bacterium]|nr:molecular chaperone DnaJ [Acidimicrobiaceae bacterium]